MNTILLVVLAFEAGWLSAGVALRRRFRAAPLELWDPAVRDELRRVASEIAQAAVAAVDRAELERLDESDVLRRLANERAQRVSAGTWTPAAADAARATLRRHQDLRGSGS
jgi:hypothetical protein